MLLLVIWDIFKADAITKTMSIVYDDDGLPVFNHKIRFYARTGNINAIRCLLQKDWVKVTYYSFSNKTRSSCFLNTM